MRALQDSRPVSLARGVIALRGTGATLPSVRGELQLEGPRQGVRIGRRFRVRARQFPVQIVVRPGGSLVVGDEVFINHGANILASLEVRIESFVKIADLVVIRDTDSHPVAPNDEVRSAPVLLQRNCWIGRSATIMPGVTIGEHAVVAAGAVVIDDVPPRTVVAGVPARVVREFEAQDGWHRP